jgi:flagellar basal-body rod modification protein FlgD
MTRISSIGATTQQPRNSSADAINDIDLGTFLELMIAELQNQDPLNPLDNKDMLAQISQIREVGATDKLTETLNSVLLGQSIASATNLIGAEIDALSDDNQKVTGIVKQVSIENGAPKLIVDGALGAEPSIETGNVPHGEHSYRVVWVGDDGRLKGVELSGENAVSTAGANDYQSIRLSNLPPTSGPKQIYRANSREGGDYQLVTTLFDGNQSSYLDTASTAELLPTWQVTPFDNESIFGRRFRVALGNVGEIRVPKTTVQTEEPTEETDPDDEPPTRVPPRPAFET